MADKRDFMTDETAKRTAPDGALIELENIHLTLASAAGPVNILRGVNLKIGRGERVGVVGPSGSGKTTMLMVMAGLERPTSGRALLAGQELGKLDEDSLARLRRAHVGIVFQSFHLIPTMTALENAAVPLELAGREDALEVAAESLAAVGLARRTTHYPGQLSGGEQQRVALARAFVTRPAVLLADEPTGNLDGETGQAVMELLFGLQARHGTTLVLISHDREIVRQCERVVRMADGRLDGSIA